MNQILVCGSIAYDHVLKHDGRFASAILPEELERLSVCFVAAHKEVHFGGCGGNIAYSLSLLEEKPILLGVMGKDRSLYEDWLASRGIDLSLVQKIDDRDMSCAYIATDDHGNQITFFHPGASGHFSPVSLQSVKERVALAIISPDNERRMVHLLDECLQHEIPYFFDPGQQLPVLAQETLRRAIDTARGIFLNDYERQLLLKRLSLSDEELIKKTRLLITTLGEKGSVIETKGRKISIPSFLTEAIVDPTGCGDAYRAGFLKGFKEGKDLEICGRMGALLAKYNLEQKGTQRHLFHLKKFTEELAA